MPEIIWKAPLKPFSVRFGKVSLSPSSFPEEASPKWVPCVRTGIQRGVDWSRTPTLDVWEEPDVNLPRVSCSSHPQTFPSTGFNQVFECLVSAQCDGSFFRIEIESLLPGYPLFTGPGAKVHRLFTSTWWRRLFISFPSKFHSQSRNKSQKCQIWVLPWSLSTLCHGKIHGLLQKGCCILLFSWHCLFFYEGQHYVESSRVHSSL